MNVIWFGLILYALAEAIVAGYRVYQKRQTTLTDQPSTLQTAQPKLRSLPQPTPATVQLEPDLDRAVPESLNQPVNEPTIQLNTDETDLSLAASLSVSEASHPDAQSHGNQVIDLHLENSEFAHSEVESESSVASEHQSVLAEISQLNETDSDDTIAQLQQSLNHPDHLVRVAIVIKLEEIAAKQGEKAAEAKEMLTQLSQDDNSDVRGQAVLVLTKIDPMVL